MIDLIPKNKGGKENDLSVTAVFDRHEHAVNMFRQAAEKMLTPSIWHKLCGAFGARFELVDAKGKRLDRKAATGDHIKIDLPGPGPTAGDGYDRLKVVLVEYSNEGKEDRYTMTLKPVPSPLEDTRTVAHFFSGAASSTFVIHRIDNVVVASYHGRNEKPDITTDNAVDDLRNAAVATMAMAGISEMQWQSLINAFLSKGT